MLLFGKQLDFRFSERHSLRPPGLHLAHEKDPESDEQNHREPGNQNGHIPGGFFFRLGRDANIFRFQNGDQVRIIGGIGLKFLVIDIAPGNIVPLNHHISDLTPVHRGEKVAENDFFLSAPGLVEEIEKKDHH